MKTRQRTVLMVLGLLRRISMYRCLTILVAVLTSSAGVQAGVPQQISHQGVVSVDGLRFDGTGDFRFAIVDPDEPINLWSNDGSITGAVGGIPTAGVSLTVTKGVYTVGLGDTSLTNMTDEIPSSVFNDDNVVLRIWFNDGVNGIQQLTPDHRLTAAPYAHRAAVIPPIGSVIAWHKALAGAPALPDGWLECNGQVVGDPTSPLDGQTLPNLNGDVHGGGGRFLRGSNKSGILQDSTLIPRISGELPNSVMATSTVMNDDGSIPIEGNSVTTGSNKY